MPHCKENRNNRNKPVKKIRLKKEIKFIVEL